MDFLASAFDLTRFGWKVFPLCHGQKIPQIAKKDGGRGCLDATDDEDVIGEWDRRYPRANIGVATGECSNIVVIDLDPRNGSQESLERLASRKQTFPDTVVARTANGGVHLYYAFEPALRNSKSALAPGIDIKTTGGYVVAPPSELVGGKKYTWLNSPLGEHLPRVPRWVVEALKPKPLPIFPRSDKPAPGTVRHLVGFVANATNGSRNNCLFWASSRAAEAGILDAAAKGAFVEAAASVGLDRIEAAKTVDSAMKRGKL